VSSAAFEFKLTLKPTGRVVSYDLRNTIIITDDGRVLVPNGPITMPEMGDVHIECKDPTTGEFVPSPVATPSRRNRVMTELFKLCYGPTRPSK